MRNAARAIAGGVAYVVHFRVRLAKALVLPFVLLVIATALQVFRGNSVLLALATTLLYLVSITLTSITTHKMILEGPDRVPTWGLRQFGEREFRFIGYQFLVGLIATPAFILAFIPGVGIYIAIAVCAYIISRLSLVFPSVAVGADIGLRESWNATSSAQLMMISAVILFPLTVGVIEQILLDVPGLAWITALTTTVTTVLVVAALSTAYGILTPYPAPDLTP